MNQLADGVFHLPLGVSNAYVLEQGRRFTLVDAGVERSAPRIRKQLAAAGKRLQDMSTVLVTHAHPDHVGGVPDLLAASGAAVWAHALEASVLRGEVALRDRRPPPETLSGLDRMLSRLGGGQPTVPVARELADGEALDEVFPGLRVVHLPGHAPGQVGFWLERERMLIGGDVLMHLPWGLTLPFRAFSHDWAEARRSAREVAEMGVNTLLLGHGAPLRNTAGQLERFRRS